LVPLVDGSIIPRIQCAALMTVGVWGGLAGNRYRVVAFRLGKFSVARELDEAIYQIDSAVRAVCQVPVRRQRAKIAIPERNHAWGDSKARVRCAAIRR